MSSLLVSGPGGYQKHPTELAKLYGKRLAVASEMVDGARFDLALVKNLTGGDRIIARFMRQDEFEFDPTHKCILSSNQLPLLGHVDKAVERRVILVKFLAEFAAPDKKLKKRMQTEAAGILAWMLEGLQFWNMRGLDVPEQVAKDTIEYLTNQDDQQLFLADACSTGPNYRTASGALFSAWQEWCEKHNAYVGSHRVFSQRMMARGFKKMHTDKGEMFLGLKLGPAGPQVYPQEDIDEDLLK